ncbi:MULTISPECIES: SDR family oxidoreductase [Novosphingobium]|uniref:SDR family oxidoreductase n=1 Tax=Novosphingobium TaxID=165696 RepID=UPI0022F24E72|nr:SDR family oxidoreductase [Novosphingobium resinovorum]GLK45638.1 short-chain dehydrogenase [Novosphingobium resinovorum]
MERHGARVVLVTGAAAGIGLATARLFAARSDTVVLADRDAGAVRRAAAELGAPHQALVLDVADEAAVVAAVAEIAAQHGGIDVLVNNAGIVDPAGTSALDLDAATVERLLRVNLTGSYLLAREAGRGMIVRGGGAIVNLSSGIALQAIAGRTPYAMSKAAILGFTRALACEWAQHGVRVNAVLPGYVATEIVEALVAEGQVDPATVAARIPLGRMARPADVAEAIVWAADNAYVTGGSIAVDGGYSAYGGTAAAATTEAPAAPQSDRPVVVISGGARGIGAATADRFAADGARVIVLDRELGALPEGREGHVLDVTDEAALVAMIEGIAAQHGRIDVLVNNAAIADDFQPTAKQTLAAFEHGLAINLVAPLRLAVAAARVMRGQGGGAIVNLSSIAARGGLPRRNSYCAAKAGVEAMTRQLACEWAQHGVRVNAVAPGYIATPGVMALEAKGKRSLSGIRRRIPLGRLGRPEEIADAIAFLASPRAGYMTGTVVPVDGGWSAFGDAGDAADVD